MIVARTVMMEGDLLAMDRMLELTGELDRHHGFARPRLPAPAKTARLVAPPPRAMLSPPDGGQGKFSSAQSLESTQNGKILTPALAREAGEGSAGHPRPLHPSKSTRSGINGASAGGMG